MRDSLDGTSIREAGSNEVPVALRQLGLVFARSLYPWVALALIAGTLVWGPWVTLGLTVVWWNVVTRVG
jgi:hypothetical protein